MNGFRKQSGASLIVGLIMLVVLTLLVVAAIRSSNVNQRIAGNMQMQNEAAAATQQAIEQVISTDFTTAPEAQQITIDTGATTYNVQVSKPECINSIPLKNDLLDADQPEDAVCINSGVNSNGGIITADGAPIVNTPSCYQQNWDIEATVSDSASGTSVDQHQGVAKRVPAGTTC